MRAALLAVLAGLLLLALPAPSQEPEVLRLVQWSDIHSGGENYHPEDLRVAIRQGLAWGPQGIVSTGDCGDNSEDPASWAHKMRVFLFSLAWELRDVKVPLVHCLGNNDLRENYQSDPDLLEETEEIFKDAFKDGYYLNRLGNGVLPVKLNGMTWISLNSNIFSRRNRYAGAEQQARETFQWLRQQLKGGPVVIVVHIPPTYDLWDNLPAWRLGCQKEFEEVLRAYPDWVTVIAGHYHRNEVHGLHRRQGDVPVLVAGSLSSKYNYAPNWRTCEWTLNHRGIPRALEYEVRYPGHPTWAQQYVIDDLNQFEEGLRNHRGFYARYVEDLFPHLPDYQSHSQQAKTRDSVLQQFWL